MANTKTDPVVAGLADLASEVEAVKRLLMALLVKVGANSEELGVILRVDDSTIRKMLAVSKIKKLKLGDGSGVAP